MSIFFHYLQSSNVVLRMLGVTDQRNIDPDDFVNRTVSRPPTDPFHTYVLSETAMTELSHAEDIYMAKDGITLEGVESALERYAVDDQFLEGRMNCDAPAKRFGFEVHSDDGKLIRATVIEFESDKPIKKIMDASGILITSYDAFVGDDGKIQQATVYPVRLRVRPRELVKPMTAELMMGIVPDLPSIEPVPVAIKFQKQVTPQKSAAAEVFAKKPAALPGLGGGPLVAGKMAPITNSFASGLSGIASASSASALPGSASVQVPVGNMTANAETVMNRFNEAMVVLHVMSRNPSMVMHETKPPSGVVRTSRKGQYSGVHRIKVDPVEFRVLVSQRAAHIREAFESPRKQGYAVPGLILVKRHDRHLASGTVSDIPPYAKCDNEDVRIEATRLWQDAEKDPAAFDALARLIEEWGTRQTRENMSKVNVYKVSLSPQRGNLPTSQSVPDSHPS